MSKPKTIFCDIDGTLCQYPYTAEMGGFDFDNKVMKPLPDTLKKLWEWDKAGHMIILTTGRKEGMRETTERQLREAGIIYDKLISKLKALVAESFSGSITIHFSEGSLMKLEIREVTRNL